MYTCTAYIKSIRPIQSIANLDITMYITTRYTSKKDMYIELEIIIYFIFEIYINI